MRKFIETDPNMTHSYGSGSNLKDFSAKINELKYIYLYVTAVGKTRISSSIYLPGYLYGINNESSKFKTHRSVKENFWTSGTTEVFYFKKLKKQGAEEYKMYIDEVLDTLNLPKDIEVRIEANKDYIQLKN